MDRNDFTLNVIDELNQINSMPEGGFFESSKEKAYRLEAMRNIFCGLKRENQDKVLRYALENMLSQVSCISEGKNLLCENF